MSEILLITLIWIHFFSDFVLQTRKQATLKSSHSLILLEHVIIYSIPFLGLGITFAIVNLILHFIIDYVTSRLSSYYWNKNEMRKFFIVIGIDQTLHVTCLILTAKYLL